MDKTQILVTVILTLNGLFLLSLFFIQRKKRMVCREYDERWQDMNGRMKDIAWDISLVTQMIAICLIPIFTGASLTFFVVTGLFIIHNLALIIAGVVVQSSKTKE